MLGGALDEVGAESRDLLAHGVRLDLEHSPRRFEDHGALSYPRGAEPKNRRPRRSYLEPRNTCRSGPTKGERRASCDSSDSFRHFSSCPPWLRRSGRRPPRSPKRPKPAPASASASTVPKVAFESYTLPNGLQVILHVDRKLPIVHVNEWFHVGSKNERPGRTGFAHLFEHMMFQGSKNASSEYFSYAERAGANLARGRRQRHDEQRPHELLHHRPVGEPRVRPLARVGPPRDARRRAHQGEARQSARRRQERAPPGSREHALRPLVQARRGEPLSRRAPVLVDGHRQPRGPDRRVARGRAGLLQDVLHAEQPLARRRRATSIRRRRRRSSRNTSARSRRARPSTGRSSGCRTLSGGKDRRGLRPRAAGARLHDLADAARLFAGRRGARPDLAHPDGRPRLASRQGRSCTTSSSAPT